MATAIQPALTSNQAPKQWIPVLLWGIKWPERELTTICIYGTSRPLLHAVAWPGCGGIGIPLLYGKVNAEHHVWRMVSSGLLRRENLKSYITFEVWCDEIHSYGQIARMWGIRNAWACCFFMRISHEKGNFRGTDGSDCVTAWVQCHNGGFSVAVAAGTCLQNAHFWDMKPCILVERC
jgi:hypothetical protein